jgi:AcrR family transcriptional regulator
LRPQKVSASLRTEERILKNALQHFCDYGYHGTSVREITAASEVTKPTLYYYYKNKEELFVKLAQTCFSDVIKQIRSCVSQELNLKDGLLTLFNAMSDIYSQNPIYLRFIYSLVVAPQKGIPEVSAERFKHEIDDAIGMIVGRAVSKGEIKKGKETCLRVVASALFGLYTGSTPTGKDEFNKPEIMNEVMDQLFQSVRS